MIRKALSCLALVAMLAAPFATAEVWNDPSGIAADDTSVTVEFPRAMVDVIVYNDDAAESVWIRLFWCGETTGAALSSDILVAATKSTSFTFRKGESNDRSQAQGYCNISVLSTSTGATVRVVAK